MGIILTNFQHHVKGDRIPRKGNRFPYLEEASVTAPNCKDAAHVPLAKLCQYRKVAYIASWIICSLLKWSVIQLKSYLKPISTFKKKFVKISLQTFEFFPYLRRNIDSFDSPSMALLGRNSSGFPAKKTKQHLDEPKQYMGLQCFKYTVQDFTLPASSHALVNSSYYAFV